MHASPVNEAPFGNIGCLIMLEIKFDVRVGVEGKLRRIGPLVAECGCFTGEVVPSFTRDLTAPTTNAFCRVD